jgi:hypothetical protein
MKQWIQRIGFVMVMVGTAVQFSQAQPGATLPARAIHKIEVNAGYIKHDAAISQFERVDDEVDRILAAGRSLHRALASDPAHHAQAEALAQVLHDLRSADWDRNVDRLEAAAEKLSALSADLMTSTR